LNYEDFDAQDKDKSLVMECVFHACDISNAARPFDI